MCRILWWFEGKKKKRKLKIFTAQLLDSLCIQLEILMCLGHKCIITERSVLCNTMYLDKSARMSEMKADLLELCSSV